MGSAIRLTNMMYCLIIQTNGTSRGFGKLPVAEKSNKPAKLGKAFSLSSSGSFLLKIEVRSRIESAPARLAAEI
ncbi:MAG: hypothetical protein U0936_01150 [Planctomycetaceae bacterium]